MMNRHQFSRASYAAVMVLLNGGITPEERYKVEDALAAADSLDDLPEDIRKKVEPTFRKLGLLDEPAKNPDPLPAGQGEDPTLTADEVAALEGPR
jgi:hypothetical protein